MREPDRETEDRRPARVALVRPIKLLWVPVVATSVAFLALYGSPHLRWSYSYQGENPRTYLSCFYLGRRSGEIIPVHGDCPLVLFLKEKGD